jgi:hypothetical protein
MNGSQFTFLDILAVGGFVLQLMTLNNVTSDDIYNELKLQDSKYLKKIIEQNEQIISMLDNSPNMADTK